MLDVARHFFTIQEVKRYIDLLAYYKINILHLHLTDDQGWRIEIKKWPKLTEVGGEKEVGGGTGGSTDAGCNGRVIDGLSVGSAVGLAFNSVFDGVCSICKFNNCIFNDGLLIGNGVASIHIDDDELFVFDELVVIPAE